MPYLVVTVRVPSPVATQLKDAAQNFGWQLADLLRTLICIGAAFAFLTARNPDRQEAASKLLGLKLVRLSRSYSLRPSHRQYAFRIPGRKSTLLTLSLPKTVCDTVSIYADLMKASRNEAYYKLLQQGQLIYLQAQMSLQES